MEVLKTGDVIGIVSPSHVAVKNDYDIFRKGLENLGLRVKYADNLFHRDELGFTASLEDRVSDFNSIIHDPEVRMVLFGGGLGAVDIVPYIDYDGIKADPKYFLSYSDGTSILNAIYANTGIPAFYGQSPGEFGNVSEYDKMQFVSNFLEGNVHEFKKNSEWTTINAGKCTGRLIGGYSVNFALTLGSRFYPYSMDDDYILLIEECDMFQSVRSFSTYLNAISQNKIMDKVRGVLFGYYSSNIPSELFPMLERFAKRNNIAAAYCEDYGHGRNHAVLPLGKTAELDTAAKTLMFI